MASRRATKPRKRPHQARAVRTVSAIVTAGAQVFVRRGYDGATTARIAERAGVSVGSLYQYFPSKDAILVALGERHVAESHGIVAEALAAFEARASFPLQALVGAMVRALVAVHTEAPALHRLLSEHTPRIPRLEATKARSDRELVARFAALVARAPAVRSEGLAVAVAIVARTVESLAHGFVLDTAGLAIDEEAFVGEVTEMCCRYLRAPSATTT